MEAFGAGARRFDSHGALAHALQADLVGATQVATGAAGAAPTSDVAQAPTILVKGSRGSAMDRIAKALLEGDATDAA